MNFVLVLWCVCVCFSQLGKEFHHKVMLVLLDKHPPMVDYLLKKKCIDLG